MNSKLFPLLLFLLKTIPIQAQNLLPGDIAVLGVSANTFDCTGISSGDEITFVCFKDIPPGTTLDLTDNGWERCQANRWGDSEGTIRFTRTGATLPAGTVLTYRLTNPNAPGTYQFVSPDNDWKIENINDGLPFSTAVNLNAGGDQLFFLAGGDWQNFGTTGDDNATYSGGILFGFNTKSQWQASCVNAPTQNSNLPASIVPCFKMEPTGTSDFAKYTGSLAPTTQLEWIDRIRNRSNWQFFTTCQAYNSAAPNYANGLKINVLPTNFGITGGPNGLCPGDTALLSLNLPTVGSPFTIGWTNGVQQFSASNIFPGNYLPVVPPASAIYKINLLEDGNGCIVRSGFNASFFLEVYPSDTTRLIETTCRPDSAGVFSKILTNRHGCDSLIERQAIFDPVACAVDYQLFTKNISCNGRSDGWLKIVATNGTAPFDLKLEKITGGNFFTGQLAAAGDTFLFANLPTGVFQIRVTDANGISTLKNFQLTEPQPLVADLEITSDFGGFSLQCFENQTGTAHATATGGTSPYVFDWSNGDTGATADSLAAGAVFLNVSDANGCALEISEVLTQPDSIEADFGAIGESCFGKNDGQIFLKKKPSGGVAPYLYSFENQTFGSDSIWKNLPPGDFRIAVEDAIGCRREFAAVLPVGTGYDFEAGADTCIFSGDSLRWKPISSRVLDTLIFSPARFAAFDFLTGGGVFFPPASLEFVVEARDLAGCLARDTFRICVEKDRPIFVPNVFSPTAQSPENQELRVFTGERGVRGILEFQIYDRFGELVFFRQNFQPNAIGLGWDGRIGGRSAGVGVFVWFAKILLSDGREVLEKGEFLLVR